MVSGDDTDLSDSMYRNFHLTPHTLTTIYKSLIPEQFPEDLQIRLLPPGVKLWLGALLQQLPEGAQGSKQHQRSKLVRGAYGVNLLHKLNIRMNNSLATSKTYKKLTSSLVSSNQYAKKLTNQALIRPWLLTTNDQTQDWTKTGRLYKFYSSSTQDTRRRTLQKSNKKPHQLHLLKK